jgi:hypothetical protein
MPRTTDAIAHLREAQQHLLLECYRSNGLDADEMIPVEHFTIAEELERIDRALGQTGTSMFAPLADSVRTAYVEITAALNALTDNPHAD